MEQRAAFSRAWAFLNFKPLAKWSALLAAAGTALCYVALLVVLGLFTDMIAYRGQAPALAELAPRQRDRFFDTWRQLPESERIQLLLDFGVDEKLAPQLASELLPTVPVDSPRYAWQSYVYRLLSERVSPEAASLYRDRLETGHGNIGILGLVVRSRDLPVINRGVCALAQTNGWMWKYGTDDNANLPYLLGLLGLALGLAALYSLLMFTMHYAAIVATTEAASRMRRAVYHHTFRLGTLAIRALGPTDAVSLFTRQVEAVHDALYAWLTVTIRVPILVGLLVLFALVVHFWLALAFLVFAALVWLIGGQLAHYFRQRDIHAANHAAIHLSLLQESLKLMRLVKCYQMELFNQGRVERQLASYTRWLRRRGRGAGIFRPLLGFLGTAATLVLLFVAGLAILDGQFSMSAAIVLVTALLSLYWPIETWLQQRKVLRLGQESAVALFKFLDRPGEVGQMVGAEALRPLHKRLEFDNVSLREPGTNRVLLAGVSLEVKAGQRIALVGSEDLEKHALVYLIPRFLDPSSGEIRCDDHNLRWVTLESLRGQIGIVMQHNLVFNDTVRNNIGCGDTAYSLPQIIEAAKRAHAHQFVQKLPKGYETPIGEMGHTLNLGEQFRVALARAILRDPALFIIEEPPAYYLDENTRDFLDDTYARVLPGRTVIFLPHRLATIRSCDQVYVLNKGKIEASGEHRELVKSNELYQHLHYLEFNVFAGQM